MNIENLAQLTNGEILTKPTITSVTDFTFSTNEVKKGFAYIALNSSQEDVDLAIENGAYAVIYDSNFEVKNSEIAYIKTKNLNTALFRLMRFVSSYKGLKFAAINAVQRSVLDCISISKNANLVNSDINKLFLKIMKAQNGDIFFCNDIKLLEKISPFYDSVWTKEIEPLFKGSIFYTSMICNEICYNNIKFPYIFIGALAGLFEFLGKNGVEFKIVDLENFAHFKAIFVDKFLNITEFGASYKSFIVESNKELFEVEARFLRENFTDIKICAKKGLKFGTKIDYEFSDLKDLRNIEDFKYALVFGNFNEIQAMLKEAKNENSLF